MNLFTFQDLVKAYYECRKNKRLKKSSAEFEFVYEKELIALQKELKSQAYKPSQFFANVYLNELDQYVKHTLKCKYYIRYVDDFVILGTDKKYLEEILQMLNVFLPQKLALALHPNKSKIESVYKGIDTLGYVTKPGYRLVRKRVVKTLKSKLLEFNVLCERGECGKKDLEFMLASINSYYAHFCHANSYKLRKHLWENHFGLLRTYFKPKNDFAYFCLKDSYKKTPHGFFHYMRDISAGFG